MNRTKVQSLREYKKIKDARACLCSLETNTFLKEINFKTVLQLWTNDADPTQ